MKNIAIIPARGGSKGIPRKNIINFKGKPLIHWTLEAALQSKFITDVYVSSDDIEILETSKISDRINIIKRPKELAEDSTRTEPVLSHVLNSLNYKEYEYLVLLQPTSPFRTSNDINNAFKKIKKTKANALISVSDIENHPYKSFKLNENGFLEGIINNDYPFMPRQVLPKTYKANGAIYIIKVESFLKNESLMTNKTTFFEMSKEKSVDIDNQQDLNILN